MIWFKQKKLVLKGAAEFIGRLSGCQVLWPRVVILRFMAASYIGEFYDRVLWCVVILSFMAASYVDQFYDRVL